MRTLTLEELDLQEKMYFSELYHLEKVTSFDKLMNLSYNNYATAVVVTAGAPSTQT